MGSSAGKLATIELKVRSISTISVLGLSWVWLATQFDKHWNVCVS